MLTKTKALFNKLLILIFFSFGWQAIADIGISKVTGDFNKGTTITNTLGTPATKDGTTLNIEIEGPNSKEANKGADLITITGEADLTGLSLVLHDDTTGTSLNGIDKWTIMTAGKGFSGKFTNVNTSDMTKNYANHVFRINEYDTSRISITGYNSSSLDKLSVKPEAKTIGKILSQEGSEAVTTDRTSMLAKVYSSVTHKTKQTTILETISEMEKLYPSNLKVFMDATNRATSRMNSTLASRYLHIYRNPETDEDYIGKFGFYADADISVARTGEVTKDKGIRGVQVGADYTFWNKLTLGGGVAYFEDDISYNATNKYGASHNTSTETRWYLNTRYVHNRNLYLSGYTSYASADYNLSRSWVSGFATDAADIATGKTSGKTTVFGGSLGYISEYDNGMYYDVYGGLNYYIFKGNDYTEKGGDNASKNVLFKFSNLERSSLFIDVGAKVSYHGVSVKDTKVVPEASFKIQERIKNNKDSYTMEYIGAGAQNLPIKALDNYDRYAKFILDTRLNAYLKDYLGVYLGLKGDMYTYNNYHSKVYLGLKFSI